MRHSQIGPEESFLQAPSTGRLRATITLAVALCGSLLLTAALIRSLLPWRGAAPSLDYQGTGVVVELLPPPSSLHPDRPVIILYHDPLPGLMDEPMRMPFLVASTRLFEGVRPGDRIAFGLKDTPDGLLVISVERLRS